METGDCLRGWRVTRALGSGAMGSVYAVENVDVPSIVAALKVLDRGLAHHPIARERFLREAEVLYTLDHEGVVRVQDIVLDHDPPFLVMELVDGIALEDRLAHGALPTDEVLRLTRRLVDVLAHMHRRRVYHRDIKPANLLLYGEGIKLVDFGLAKKLGEHPITMEGRTHFGTASYCPPEWIGAEPVDPQRWDAYALGVVVYEMLTGEVGFPMPADGSAGQRILWVMAAKAGVTCLDPGPEAPPALREFVQRTTSTDQAAAWTDLDVAKRHLG